MRREDAYVEVEFRIGTKKSKLKALVDTESTENIISKELAERLRVSVSQALSSSSSLCVSKVL